MNKVGENILYEKSTLLRAIHDEVSLDDMHFVLTLI